ncbi:hypothetical protein V7654_02210 [Bacillus sp. JJ1609]|uniref:hypothetical protein n=1 Tax=Bacillus sp. JJ1609 TaxID=3122977 RepID=UPI002FFDAB40
MQWKIFRLVLGFICGYLSVNWLPLEMPYSPDEFLSVFILHPIEFLAGTIALIIGMYVQGGLIRNGIIAVFKTLKGKNGVVSDIILAIGSIGCFFLLIPLGIWQTCVFFSFCFLYGMISLSPLRTEKGT